MLIMDEVTLSYIVFMLAGLPWICYTLVAMFYVVAITYSRCKLHKKLDPNLFLNELPGVSIIKPLMGLDPFLEGNLESHFSLNYPKFELLLCVQDDEDPAINLVHQLCERYPKVDARLFIGGKEGVMNPMVNNMALGYDNAKYDLVWISTSRIYANTDVILDMVAKIQNPKTAIVHQMPYTMDQKGLAATVEKVYFGCGMARAYLTLHVLRTNCFTGMSYLFKKEELDKLKGLSWFGRFLAEDFFISKYLHEAGFRHQVAAVPAQQNVANQSIVAYKDRMVRWMRLRMNMIPFVALVLEPLNESIPLGVYMSWSMFHFFQFNPYIYFCIHILAWMTLDYILLRGVQNGGVIFSIPEYMLAWIIRELLYILCYFEALINVRRIKWGKRTYRLSNFGESIEIVSDKSILPL